MSEIDHVSESDVSDTEVSAGLASLLAHAQTSSAKIADIDKNVIDVRADMLEVKTTVGLMQGDLKELLQLAKRPAAVASAVSPSVAPTPRFDRFGKVRRVIENPMAFEDFRPLKEEGRLAAKHPDFKSLDGTFAVWVDDPASMPEDLKAALASLPADRPIGSPEARYKRKWETMLADPSAYEDLRVYKAAVPARNSLPDFRVAGSAAREHALWLDAGNVATPSFLERLDACAQQPTVVQPDS